MSDELLSRTDGAVHRLTINRPARRNALTPTLARALAQALDRGRGSRARPSSWCFAARAAISRPGSTCIGSVGWARFPPSPSCSAASATFQAAVLAVVRCPVPGPGRGRRHRRGLRARPGARLRPAARVARRQLHLGLRPHGAHPRRRLDLHVAAVWSGSAPRSVSCSRARRSMPPARWPSAWWTRWRTRGSSTRR